MITAVTKDIMCRGVARGGSKGSDEPPFQTKKFLNIASQA